MDKFRHLLLALICAGAVTACSQAPVRIHPTAAKILEGAKRQLAKPAKYSGAYHKIPYPGGDVPADRGACTDVIIRAFRHAGLDLQKLIHEDAARVSYPRIGSKRDRNIDHRRVPNQRRWLERHGQTLPIGTTSRDRATWKPGDIVVWKLSSGLDHIGIISDRNGPSGFPLVIHNIWQTAEEDVLTTYKIVGHFRYPKG